MTHADLVISCRTYEADVSHRKLLPLLLRRPPLPQRPLELLPPLYNPALRFSARTVRGAGRGRGLKVPTINMDLSDAPKSLEHGIYVCRVGLDGKSYDGALHYGPRLVFNDSESLEVHVLDSHIDDVPERIDIVILARIRDVRDFPDAEALKAAIADDIRITRGILASCDSKAS